MGLLKKVLERYEVASGLSPVLYHYTYADFAVRILKSNRFRLRVASGVERQKGSTKLYYLSTARTPYGSYTSKFGVKFVLDGTKLGHNYKGTQVDYFSKEGYKSTSQRTASDEYEDRILSDKPYIEDAAKYIKEIHYSRNPNDGGDARQLVLEAKRHGIPLFFYTDQKSFEHLIKKNAVKPTNLEGPATEDRAPRHKKREFKKWLELYHSKDIKSLSKDGRQLLHILNHARTATLLEEAVQQASKSEDPQDQRFMAVWRKHGFRSAKDFLDFLTKKYNPLIKADKDFRDDVSKDAMTKGEAAKKDGKPLEQLLVDLKDYLKQNPKKHSKRIFFNDWYNGYHYHDMEKVMDDFQKLSPDEQTKIQKGHEDAKKALWEKAKGM